MKSFGGSGMSLKARRAQRSRASGQRGISLLGLMVWAIVIGFVGYVLVRALPTVNEYLTIQSSINKIAATNPTTVGEIRGAFDKQKEVEYSISAISGKDLDITKENDKVVIGFAYEKEIELIEPVYLLIKYKGRTK
jgi:Domain of unknown function (DUF4845)